MCFILNENVENIKMYKAGCQSDLLAIKNDFYRSQIAQDHVMIMEPDKQGPL